MRGTLRLLASVKPVRYLEAGAPTGLTGLRTNPSPRSTLLYLYNRTLDKLANVPETSLYRQSVEAVTKHRLGLVQGVKPTGYDEWAAKAREFIQQHPQEFTNAEAETVKDVEAFFKTSDAEEHETSVIAPKVWSYLEGLSLEGKPYYLRPELSQPSDQREEDAVDIARFDIEETVPELTPEEEEALRKYEAEGEPEKKKLEFQSEEELQQYLKKQQEAQESAAKEPEPEPYVAPDLVFLENEPRLTADQWVLLL